MGGISYRGICLRKSAGITYVQVDVTPHVGQWVTHRNGEATHPRLACQLQTEVNCRRHKPRPRHLVVPDGDQQAGKVLSTTHQTEET